MGNRMCVWCYKYFIQYFYTEKLLFVEHNIYCQNFIFQTASHDSEVIDTYTD